MFSFDFNLKSWSLTLGKSLMSIPILTVVSVLLGSEFLKKKEIMNGCSNFSRKSRDISFQGPRNESPFFYNNVMSSLRLLEKAEI